MIRIAETFAIFGTFAVNEQWARCWWKTSDLGQAPHDSLYAVESMTVEVESVTTGGTVHKSQNAACIKDAVDAFTG